MTAECYGPTPSDAFIRLVNFLIVKGRPDIIELIEFDPQAYLVGEWPVFRVWAPVEVLA